MWWLLFGVAAAAPLQVNPASPPVLVGFAPDLGGGAVELDFPDGGGRKASLPAVIVSLRSTAAVPPALRAAGVALGTTERTWRIPVAAAEIVEVSVFWAQDPAVSSVLPDLILPLHSRFDDPRYASQWYMESLGMDPLFALTLGDPEVRVAVIDSAIDVTHPDLAAGMIPGYDAFDDDNDTMPNPGEFCQGASQAICDIHGTAVSGIIGARSNNAEGIVGLCSECTLIPIKMLGEGDGALSAEIKAFEFAIDNDAAVINNSWGYTEPTRVPQPLADVIARAATETRGGKGSVVVFAAGNDDRELGNDEVEALADVVCVSATDIYGNPTAYTNFGDAVDVAAPSATFTTAPEGQYTETFGGTSAAAPVVSGIAAWILSVNPELTADDVHQLLIDTALPSPRVTFDENGHHPIYGYGDISPANLLSALTETEDEEPKGCDCGNGGSGDSSALVWLGAPLWLLARRRRG